MIVLDGLQYIWKLFLFTVDVRIVEPYSMLSDIIEFLREKYISLPGAVQFCNIRYPNKP